MPIYEYECRDCQKVFEVQQKISDEPLKECPQCKGDVKKLISANSFQLKGGGWYADGYSSVAAGKTPACSSSAEGGCGGCSAAK